MADAEVRLSTNVILRGDFSRRGWKVLVMQRAKGAFPGGWWFPGGGVDIGESPSDGALRELREEAGLTVDGALELVAAVPYRIYGRDSLKLIYTARFREQPIILNEEHSEHAWIDPVEFCDRVFGDAAVDATPQLAPYRSMVEAYIAWADHAFEDLQLRDLGMTAECYVVRDGRILVLKRRGGIGDGFWYIPGGIVERGEDPEAAAIRETFEETGLAVEAVEHIRTWSWRAQNNRDAYQAAFIAHAPAGEVTVSREHWDHAWLTPREYLARHLPPSARSSAPEFASFIAGVERNMELAERWIAAQRPKDAV